MKTWQDFGLDFPESFTGEISSTCPKCSDERKNSGALCLSANGDKLVWICHHCTWHGSLNDGEYKKADPLKWKETTYYVPGYIDLGVGQSIYDYFKTRGISEETVRKNKIGYGMVYMPQLKAQASALMFPFYRDGKCVNIKYRTFDKQFRLETNAERIFYGMDDVTVDTAIIVEGEIDKLSIQEAGHENCVSVPDGAPSEKAKDVTAKFSFLEAAEKWLEGKVIKKIVVVPNRLVSFVI
jgi:twinkle protein